MSLLSLQLRPNPDSDCYCMSTSHYFEHALLGSGWARNVRVCVDDMGDIGSVEVDTERRPNEAATDGYAIPGIPNVHSHAFQRAMRGMAEYSGGGQDSFWTWREY